MKCTYYICHLSSFSVSAGGKKGRKSTERTSSHLILTLIFLRNMTKKKRRFPVQPVLTYEKFLNKLETYKIDLESSLFYTKLREQLEQCSEDLHVNKVDQILCYGLGNFTESLSARYQLALLILLKSHYGTEVYIYDPVFSSVEIEFLKNLQLCMIDRNEEGARDVNSTSLVYLPHCPTPLINNLLWHNWCPRISNCIILGNSFQSLSTSCPESKFKKNFFYIHSILPFTKELEILNIYTYTDIFNNMSLHYFPSSLSQLPQTFWENKAKPEYDDIDIECISGKLKNSKIDDTEADKNVENGT